MTWIDVAYYTIGLIISAVVAFITGRFSLKHLDKTLSNQKEKEKEEREFNLKLKEAEDLEKILFSALNTNMIDRLIATPGKLSCDFWEYLEQENDEDLKSLLHFLLNKTQFSQRGDIKIFADFIRDTYAERVNLSAFFKRYNRGTWYSVTLDVDKLNKDIDFVNQYLGKHYEKY